MDPALAGPVGRAWEALPPPQPEETERSGWPGRAGCGSSSDGGMGVDGVALVLYPGRQGPGGIVRGPQRSLLPRVQGRSPQGGQHQSSEEEAGFGRPGQGGPAGGLP